MLRRTEVVTTRELRALGYSRDGIRTPVSHGDLLRLHRGVFVDGRTRTGPWTRLKAALLTAGPTAFLSHRTAAAARNYRPINVRDIHITVVAKHTPRIPGLKIHRISQEPGRGEVSTTGGLRASTLPRILVELAPTAKPHELQELITAGERRRALETMPEILTRHAQRRGAPALRAALAGHITLPDGNSGLEREVWAWYLTETDLRAPDATNVRLGPYEFDGLWERERLILEIDSRTYHQAREDMEKDRVKDACFQKLGYRIIRITDHRFHHDRAGCHADLAAFLIQPAAIASATAAANASTSSTAVSQEHIQRTSPIDSSHG